MNEVICNGYLQRKVHYVKDKITGNYEYRFYLNVFSAKADGVSVIPFKCTGWLADEAYSKLQVGDYIEIIGELVRENQIVYVLVKELVYKKPKSSRQVHIKTSEFLQTFQPSEVIERLVKKGVNNSGKKKV